MEAQHIINKADLHYITEILLKVALNTITLTLLEILVHLDLFYGDKFTVHIYTFR